MSSQAANVNMVPICILNTTYIRINSATHKPLYTTVAVTPALCNVKGLAFRHIRTRRCWKT